MDKGYELYKKVCEYNELTKNFNQLFFDENLQKNIDERSKLLKESFEKISKCSLITWLNKNLSFKEAKRRIEREGLINSDLDSVNLYGGYQSVLFFENFFAGIFYFYFINREKIISKRCVTRSKFISIKKDANKLKKNLEEYLIFEVERKQERLINLLNQLSIEENSIYNIKKLHSNSLRQIMMKDILSFIICIGNKKLTKSAIAEIALDIAGAMAGIFFDTNMDKTDIMNEIRVIERNLYKNHEFWRQEFRERKYSIFFCPNCVCQHCEIGKKDEYFQESLENK